MKKTPLLIGISLLCTSVLSGCADISFGEQTLLRPPRATGDSAEIQNIIREEAGSSYTMKYPANGDHRSAVTIFSTKKDKTEYAAAFYSTENDSKLNISIIRHNDDEWECLGSFSNAGTGVDRMILDDINNDGQEEIVVGWSTYNTGLNNLSAYSFEGESVREMILDESYTDLAITDITGDNLADLVLLSLRNEKSPSSAKLLQYSEQEKKPIAKFSLDLDSEVIKFSSISCGMIDNRCPGIIIEGAKAGDLLTTQLIYFDKKTQMLANPLVTTGTNGTVNNVTTRKDVITARDIDTDGITEVPVVSPMPAPPDTDASSVCSMTTWKQLHINDGTLKQKMVTVTNYNDGYYFIMPDSWNGNVTAINHADDRCIVFYKWNKDSSVLGKEIMEIRCFTSSEWAKADQDEYDLQKNVKKKNNEYIIAAKLYKTDKNTSITEKELEGSLILMK